MGYALSGRIILKSLINQSKGREIKTRKSTKIDIVERLL
jgi:hypothetical protein